MSPLGLLVFNRLSPRAVLPIPICRGCDWSSPPYRCGWFAFEHNAFRLEQAECLLYGAFQLWVMSVDDPQLERANNVPVEYIVFPDEGHGFRNKKNQERGYRAILAFPEQHLRGIDTPAVMTDQP